jgi:S1-C subfamily serine protease/CheY-like chemotaxis protein
MTLDKATDREGSTNSDVTPFDQERRAPFTDVPNGTIAPRDKVLLLEGEMSSRHALETIVGEAGYEVTSTGSCHDGLRLARETRPDVLVLDETLAGFDCGDLLAELKTASSTQGVRAILLVSGGAPERVHALDLGADDVLSRPFESIEFQARVRRQLRLKRIEDELRDRLRIIEQSQQVSRAAMAASEKVSRNAFGLTRAVKVGLFVLLAALAATGVLYYRLSRRASGDIQRSYAAVTALNRSLANEQDLIERARKLSEQMKAADASTSVQKEQLVRRSKQLLSGLSQAPADSAVDLHSELAETEARLQKLEGESSLAEKIIKDYAPSVCLMYVAVVFRDANGRSLRYATTPEGDPIEDGGGAPRLTLEGSGDEFRMNALGTGFLVSKDGRVLTNRHVVEPWWHNDDLEDFTKQGLKPAVVEMRAYFPGSLRAYVVNVVHISADADLALMRGQIDTSSRHVLALDGSLQASVRGESIVLMGYATGLDAVLARLDDSTLQDTVTESRGDSRQILDRLAEKNLIRPLITQGHLGDVLPEQIVYDAQTAAGGSGGPVFNREGKVIGVNHAVIEGFGGSNFGVPARFAEPLLAR